MRIFGAWMTDPLTPVIGAGVRRANPSASKEHSVPHRRQLDALARYKPRTRANAAKRKGRESENEP
jgi:hypothetical protein